MMSRNNLLDQIKGLAITFMVLAHVSQFFYDHYFTIPWIRNLRIAANTFSASTFLGVFGAVIAIQYISSTNIKTFVTKAVRRGFIYYSAYCIYAILYLLFFNKEMLNNIVGYIALTKPVGFLEYFPVFILLPLYFKIFLSILKKIQIPTMLHLILVGIFCFISFFLSEQIQLIINPKLSNSIVIGIMSILFGVDGMFTFPLFRYIISLGFGYILFSILYSNSFIKRHTTVLLISCLITSFLIIFYYFFQQGIAVNFQIIETQRWPPTLLHITGGIFGFLLFSVCATLLSKTPLGTVLAFYGKHAFYIVFSHHAAILIALNYDSILLKNGFQFILFTFFILNTFFLPLMIYSILQLLVKKYIITHK